MVNKTRTKGALMSICAVIALASVVLCGYGYAAFSSDLMVSGEATIVHAEVGFTSTYLQDLKPAECAVVTEGVTGEMKDRRDNNVYTVKKMRDGGCWMVSDLALKLTASGLNTSTSDITTTWNSRSTYKPTATKTTLDLTEVKALTETAVASWLYNGRMYYTFNAATAGTGTAAATDGAIATGSICPKGWRLPMGGTVYNQTNGSWENMLASYGLNSTRVSSTGGDVTYALPGGTLVTETFVTSQYSVLGVTNLTRAGIIRPNASSSAYYPGPSGVFGYYWSSVGKSATTAYNIDYGTTSLYRNATSTRSYGALVRCALRMD